MQSIEPTLNYSELAKMFRRSPATIPNTIRNWMLRRYFPAPLPGARPRLWSAARVLAWIDAPDDDARFALSVVQSRDEIEGALPEAVVLDFTRRLREKYARRA